MDSLDTNLDDLATTVDASEMLDTTDEGRLTSPLFSGARSKCYPAQCFWFSGTFKRGRPMRDTDPFSNIGKPVQDVESFSSFQRSLLKGKRNRELESVQDSQIEKVRMLSRQKGLHEFLEKRVD